LFPAVPGIILDLRDAAPVLVVDRTEGGAEKPGQEAGPDIAIPENTGGYCWTGVNTLDLEKTKRKENIKFAAITLHYI